MPTRLRSTSLFGQYTRPPSERRLGEHFGVWWGGSPSSAICASLFRLGPVPKQLGESLVCGHVAVPSVQMSYASALSPKSFEIYPNRTNIPD